jgi:hypothetical protein
MLRGLVQKCPVGDFGAPETRTDHMHAELLQLADQLDGEKDPRRQGVPKIPL